jgi:DNA-binding transcriptional MerR regulator
MDSNLECYTIRETAKILGLEKDSVRMYVSTGILPSCGKNSKGRCLISRAAIERHHMKRKKTLDFGAVQS